MRLALGEGTFPVLRPRMERWYEAHVVLEDEPTAELWASPLGEFADVLRATGAFLLVRSWRLRLDAARPRDLKQARLQTPAGGYSSPRTLAGRSHRLVFFASSGTSVHWADGVYANLLKSWSGGGLVLLHLLPRRGWLHTPLGEPQGLARASRPGSAATALNVQAFGWQFGLEISSTSSPSSPGRPRPFRLSRELVPYADGPWTRERSVSD